MVGWSDFENVCDILAFSLNSLAEKGPQIPVEKLGPLKAPSLRDFLFNCCGHISISPCKNGGAESKLGDNSSESHDT